MREKARIYRALGQTDAGRCLSIFFIYKRQGRALIISARDADMKELRTYGRKKNKTGTQRDPLPDHFSSLEDAAAFWDTHDSSDYEEYFHDVDVKFDIKKRTHLISMDGSLYNEVRKVAKKKRVQTEKLVTRWIKEKLRSAA